METLKPIVFTASAATLASMTEIIDLNGSYQKLALEIPSMTPYAGDTQIFIQGSSDGSTFRRLAQHVENTATVAVNDFVIPSATSNRFIPINVYGLRYLKIETTAVVTTPTAIFKVVCLS